jgi:hypothetical protein
MGYRLKTKLKIRFGKKLPLEMALRQWRNYEIRGAKQAGARKQKA